MAQGDYYITRNVTRMSTKDGKTLVAMLPVGTGVKQISKRNSAYKVQVYVPSLDQEGWVWKSDMKREFRNENSR